MAKKIVRGITDVKTINNQDFDTNNVNDLLSDGQYNYIHRKKGKNEEYHNLTDNIKTLSSDNTELLSVTNNNKTTNTATLHPKHDAQKEQVLESTRDTIAINHGANGTDEKTTVDTNPEKVLEHDNLLTDYGISKVTSGNTTKLGLEYTKVADGFDLNNLGNGNIRGEHLVNTPNNNDGGWFFVSSVSLAGGGYVIQEAIRVLDSSSTKYKRTKNDGVWGAWRVQLGDKSTIDALLSQKQDVLTAGEGITIEGHTISATGSSTSTVQYFIDSYYRAYEHRVETSDGPLLTFSFECYNTAETVITGELEQTLALYLRERKSISNGALTITYDGTTMKLINSAPSENVNQHATFTFYGNPIT